MGAIVTLSIFLLVLISVPNETSVAAQCKGDLSGMVAQCPKYVSKSGPKLVPSKECCRAVKTIDVLCACKYLIKEIERLVSMEKVVFVVRHCGIKIARGTKCGDYTVP